MNQTASAAGTAEGTAKQVMGGRIDQSFHTESQVYRLLDEPIANVRLLLSRGPVDILNAGGKALCDQLAQISGKYPFKPGASEDVPIDQLNVIFAPKTGALWVFYDTKLKQYLPGPPYQPVEGGAVKLNPNFYNFFSRAATFSRAMYGQDSPTPKFSYSLTEMPSNVEGLTLKIGKETLSGPAQSKSFTWTGAPEDIQVTTKGGDILGSYSGPWSIFKFVSDARSPVSGSTTNLEWILQANGKPIMLPNGKQKSYSYQLQVNGLNPFRSQEWTSMRCVAQVAH